MTTSETILIIGAQIPPDHGLRHGAVRVREPDDKWYDKEFKSRQERKQFERLRRFIENPNLLKLRQDGGTGKGCRDQWLEHKD